MVGCCSSTRNLPSDTSYGSLGRMVSSLTPSRDVDTLSRMRIPICFDKLQSASNRHWLSVPNARPESPPSQDANRFTFERGIRGLFNVEVSRLAFWINVERDGGRSIQSGGRIGRGYGAAVKTGLAMPSGAANTARDRAHSPRSTRRRKFISASIATATGIPSFKPA